MTMDYRKLDVTIISANDLTPVKILSKGYYVVVSILDIGRFLASSQRKTLTYRISDTNPTWNYKTTFDIDDMAAQQNRLSIQFDVFCRRTLLPDKHLGEVGVPISELLSDSGESNYRSYQVRKRSGKSKGVLNFSYKFGDKYSVPIPRSGPMGAAAWGQPVTAYPAATGGGYGYGYGYGQPYQGQGYGGYGQGYGGQQGGGRSNFGMGMGAGLLGGALAGMLIGDVVSDMAYGGGYDGGGFDGGDFSGGF